MLITVVTGPSRLLRAHFIQILTEQPKFIICGSTPISGKRSRDVSDPKKKLSFVDLSTQHESAFARDYLIRAGQIGFTNKYDLLLSAEHPRGGLITGPGHQYRYS